MEAGHRARRLSLGIALGLAVLAALASFPLLHRDWRGAPAPSAALGMTVEFDPHAARPDLLVTSLRSDGAARRAGLEVGDRIERIDDVAPASVRQVEHALHGSQLLRLIVTRHARRLNMVLRPA